jgi:hypothetical protein
MTDKPTKKDIRRGTMNRVADGTSLLQEGNAESDHAHVSTSLTMMLKRKELMNDPRYNTEAAPDTDKVRERVTASRPPR